MRKKWTLRLVDVPGPVAGDRCSFHSRMYRFTSTFSFFSSFPSPRAWVRKIVRKSYRYTGSRWTRPIITQARCLGTPMQAKLCRLAKREAERGYDHVKTPGFFIEPGHLYLLTASGDLHHAFYVFYAKNFRTRSDRHF